MVKAELAKWVTSQYGNEWRIHFMTNTKAPSKRKSTSANSSPKRSKSYVVSAFKDAFNGLSAHYNHDAVTIGDEEYLLFNVPADHQCLFHSIAADIRPLYKGKSRTFEEVRKGVIAQSCSGKLKDILDTEWPGVTQMTTTRCRWMANTEEMLESALESFTMMEDHISKSDINFCDFYRCFL